VFKSKALNGKHASGMHAPYGYVPSTVDKFTWVIDEPAAVIVKEIFQMRLSGVQLSTIAQSLWDRGIKTPPLTKQSGMVAIPELSSNIPTLIGRTVRLEIFSPTESIREML
jgi:hypothetical protein